MNNPEHTQWYPKFSETLSGQWVVMIYDASNTREWWLATGRASASTVRLVGDKNHAYRFPSRQAAFKYADALPGDMFDTLGIPIERH